MFVRKGARWTEPGDSKTLAWAVDAAIGRAALDRKAHGAIERRRTTKLHRRTSTGIHWTKWSGSRFNSRSFSRCLDACLENSSLVQLYGGRVFYAHEGQAQLDSESRSPGALRLLAKRHPHGKRRRNERVPSRESSPVAMAAGRLGLSRQDKFHQRA